MSWRDTHADTAHVYRAYQRVQMRDTEVLATMKIMLICMLMPRDADD